MLCQIILLFDINVVLMLPWRPDVTIVQSDVTIILIWQLSTRSIHDYIFRYIPSWIWSVSSVAVNITENTWKLAPRSTDHHWYSVEDWSECEQDAKSEYMLYSQYFSPSTALDAPYMSTSFSSVELCWAIFCKAKLVYAVE